ncbi:MAG: cell envelope biogenesis protein TolA [Sphingomonas sp.]|uniref:cell envelope biogenesis protein TolA n=1 Tax=Sphingomonas sp. TaxID=28214 RepID=UPI001AC65464|nr:cell envelope biogenesis protein TolA [Sphingomonas sp.]MBN8816672.1 cell envelope biogenesis protein TolA [Sphingomonas sp.]
MTASAASSFDRQRALEFGASAALHAVLLVGLSVVLLSPPKPPPPPAPMDVTIADDVGLVAAAPQNLTPPAQSRAPDLGKPEDAAPSAPAPEVAEPAPPKPQPVAPTLPKPAEVAKPQPRKPAPPKPQPAKVPARPAPSSNLAKIVGKGSGATPGATANRPRGSSLGGVMSGLGTTLNNSKSTTPQGAVMSQQAAMDIGQKIKQQVQPCANRQTNPGPGAERIRVTIRLRINRDGTLAARPTIEGHDGVDGDNARYQRQVDDRAIATFMGCQPLRGLPPDLYDVPNGWSNFLLRYKLPG